MATTKFRFTKVREVKSPTRHNEGDAGLDFYVPTDLTIGDLLLANPDPSAFDVSIKDGKVYTINLKPQARIKIPSGIRGLLEPKDSMMMVANKSGKSTKLGLIFTAQICDSPYVGEYNLAVYNTSSQVVTIKAGEPLVQMIHTPIYLTNPEEIDNDTYEKESKNWGTRGTDGFGSGDKGGKTYEPTNPSNIEGD
jgi:dUTP diphosphatase